MVRRTSKGAGTWIGVDLDATLAEYDHWRGYQHIGAPIPLMLERVKEWLRQGEQVRIFTARAADPGNPSRPFIEEWCREHLGQVLPVTAMKDYGLVEFWDDRAVQVLPNSGKRADGKPG